MSRCDGRTAKRATAHQIVDIAEHAREEARCNKALLEIVEAIEEDRAGRVDREQVEHFKVVDLSTELEEVTVAGIHIHLETSLVDFRVELVSRTEDARTS